MSASWPKRDTPCETRSTGGTLRVQVTTKRLFAAGWYESAMLRQGLALVAMSQPFAELLGAVAYL
jgi:hypothetical protein